MEFFLLVVALPLWPQGLQSMPPVPAHASAKRCIHDSTTQRQLLQLGMNIAVPQISILTTVLARMEVEQPPRATTSRSSPTLFSVLVREKGDPERQLGLLRSYETDMVWKPTSVNDVERLQSRNAPEDAADIAGGFVFHCCDSVCVA